MTVYLHAVSSAPPGGSKTGYETGPVMIAIAVESSDTREITSTLIRRMAPEAGWRVDLAWCARYGCGLIGQDETTLASAVSDEVVSAIVQSAPIVSHFAAFHLRFLAKMIGADHPIMSRETACTMAMATNPCGIPDRWGRGLKSPSLGEAHEFFTGERLRALDDPGLHWLDAALVYLTATRRIWWGLHRWGIAPEIKSTP